MRREPAKEEEPVLISVNVPDIEALPLKDAVPTTSRSPDMRRSLPDFM